MPGRLIAAVAVAVAILRVSSPLYAADEIPPVQLPDMLTMDDALQIFRTHGLDLLIAEAAVASAEGDLKSAGAVPNPNFSVGIYKSFFGSSPGAPPQPLFETDLGWFIGLGDSNAIVDSLSGKRGLRLSVARAALRAAKQSRVDAQRTLEFQVKQVYIQAVLARDALDFALEVQKNSDQTFNLTRIRYEAGDINEADEAKVEATKLEADQAVDTATQALRVAKVGLAFLLGVRGPVPDFRVEQDLPKFAVSGALAQSSRDSLLREAYENRADLRAIQAQRDRAEAAIRLARRLRFPDLNFNVQYSQQGSSAGVTTSTGQVITPIAPPTLQFSIGGTLPVFYQQGGEIRKAEADYRAQNAQRAKIEAQVVTDVETAFTNFESSRRLVERMEARLLDRVKRARDLVQLQYQKGKASLLEFLDAQRQYISTNVEYLQELASYWIAVYQLEEAVGVDLR